MLFRSEDYRLACASEIKGDILVFVPEESRKADQVVLDTGKERVFNLDPAVKNYFVKMPAATLDDHRSDLNRLQDAIKEQYGLDNLSIDYFILRELPNIIREGEWQVTATVLYDREIVDVKPGFSGNWYGIGIDVGTTTVAAYLCDE